MMPRATRLFRHDVFSLLAVTPTAGAIPYKAAFSERLSTPHTGASAKERRGKLDEAKAAYLLLLEKRLPLGGTIARSRLEQMGVHVSRPGQ